MNKITLIENQINSLSGGSFESFGDMYIRMKYKFELDTPGKQAGSDKVLTGIPDSIAYHEDGTYTLIMYGSHPKNQYTKLKQDIEDALNFKNTEIQKSKIRQIICLYTGNSLKSKYLIKLKMIDPNVNLKIISCPMIAQDICLKYPSIAKDFFNIELDSGQLSNMSEFIDAATNSLAQSPLNTNFYYRISKLDSLLASIENNFCTIIHGKPGIGKTRIALEACKKFQDQGYHAFCIKNNGNDLDYDLNVYLSNESKVIILIDDCDEFEKLVDIITWIRQHCENSKIIMTTRNYSLKAVLNQIPDKRYINTMSLDTMSDEEISQILQNELGINNNQYLNRISEISNGNVRLAIFAGMSAKQEGFKPIQNPKDTFEWYFEQIIKKTELSIQEIQFLFVVSFMQHIKINPIQDEMLAYFLNYFEIKESDLSRICSRLNKLQLISVFNHRIIKIIDQSFGEYLLQKILFEEKTISVSKIIGNFFPKYTNTISRTLSIALNVYQDEKIINYIKAEVNKCWDAASDEDQESYLEIFHGFNEAKSLRIIAEHIKNMKTHELDQNYDFENEVKNNSYYSDDLIVEILTDFKHSEYLGTSLELLFQYLIKRPENFRIIYNKISSKLLFDSNSPNIGYINECKIEKKLIDIYNNNTNKVVKISIMYLSMYLLNCDVQNFSNDVRSDLKGKLIQYTPVLTTEYKELRLLCWGNILDSNKNEYLHKYVQDWLMNINEIWFSRNDTRDIVIFDVDFIRNHFIEEFDTSNIRECWTLYRMMLYLAKNEIVSDQDEFVKKYRNNHIFEMIMLLNDGHRNADDNQEKIMLDEFLSTNKMEFHEVIDEIIQNLDIFSRIDIIENNLMIIMKRLLENDNISDYFLAIVQEKCIWTEYFQKFIVTNWCDVSSHMQVYLTSENSNRWMCAFWNYIPVKYVDKNICNKFLQFYSGNDVDEYPKLYNLKKYVQGIPNVAIFIGEKILHSEETFSLDIFFELENPSDDIVQLVSLFDSKISILENLLLKYTLNARDTTKIVSYLAGINFSFWMKFLKKIFDPKNSVHDQYISNVFRNIWNLESYKKYIDSAYEYLLNANNKSLFIFQSAKLFSTDGELADFRKKEWIETYISANILKSDNMIFIFEYISGLSNENKIDYYQLFLNQNDGFDDFKKLPLFSRMRGYWNSEVPLIEKENKFVDSLINILLPNGTKFIQHMDYLESVKNSLNESKISAEAEDFLKDR
ncbi:hypothetical protein [Companilactobacillus sp.]|uniref:nSTAND3 domain-containing NTPase n=1 Tax=Companilactobacillus sp. TaxID=2767905 RepID=UPI00261AEFA2|nr:hypothetical protein [Companilactobacillus sp.]